MEVQKDFKELLELLNEQKVKYGDISVCYIGRKELIKNKKATARKKDIADIEALGEQ